MLGLRWQVGTVSGSKWSETIQALGTRYPALCATKQWRHPPTTVRSMLLRIGGYLLLSDTLSWRGISRWTGCVRGVMKLRDYCVAPQPYSIHACMCDSCADACFSICAGGLRDSTAKAHRIVEVGSTGSTGISRAVKPIPCLKSSYLP